MELSKYIERVERLLLREGQRKLTGADMNTLVKKYDSNVRVRECYFAVIVARTNGSLAKSTAYSKVEDDVRAIMDGPRIKFSTHHKTPPLFVNGVRLARYFEEQPDGTVNAVDPADAGTKTFDEWFLEKYGSTFEFIYEQPHSLIAESMKQLSREVRFYVSEMMR